MRAVVDTNVLVSAVLGTGNPYRVYRAWLDQRFELIMTPALIGELDRVFARRRISRRIQSPAHQLNTFVGTLRQRAVWIEPERSIEEITADPDDNRVLEAAVEGAADYIVTGDRDLLDLGEYAGTRIVTPRDFTGILAAETNP